MYILVTLLLLYNTGRVQPTCTVAHCQPDTCDFGYCQTCIDGYYRDSNGQCYGCARSSCLKCTGYNSCSECQPSYYGLTCQITCPGCTNDVCDKESGDCLTGCKDGFYIRSSGGCASCYPKCAKCTTYSACSECSAGKFGTYCTETCLGCIDDLCNINTGACTSGCTNGYFAVSDGRCNICRSNCDMCDTYDDCSSCIAGWWGSYCQNDCQGCRHPARYCTKASGCIYGCKDGYFEDSSKNGKYCASCPDHCMTCADTNTCLSCETGYNGTKCQYDCRNCNGDICNGATGHCIFNCASDQYFDEKASGCKQCPTGCTACTSSTYCTACATGKWGNVCNYFCNTNCKDSHCAKNNGYCVNGCSDGFYGPPRCSSSCLLGCKSCSNAFSCISCKDDYFSRNNNAKCECNVDNCAIQDAGKCTQCSTSQWYPHTRGCCPCSTNCANNTCFSNKTCLECKSSRYGDQCQSRCNANCRNKLCYRDGTCISCGDNRYGPACNNYCSHPISYCKLCYVNEANSITCTRCYSGTYVKNNRCISCHQCKAVSRGVSKCNTATGSCTKGCIYGYYGDKCDSKCNVTNCFWCPNNPNICQECKDGFYGEGDSVCTKCPANCKVGTICSKLNGSCTSGCLVGWSGEICSQPCMSGCKSCDQSNSSLCDACLNGLYGNQCEKNCSWTCKELDGNKYCNKSNGYCEHGCKESFWDHTCASDCGAGCNGSLCNRTSGVCINGCTHEYYGTLCKTQCSKHCVSRENDTAERSCHNYTGDCLIGCVPGWFGRTCENECSKQCNASVCDRDNGTCTFGCVEGYIGSNCLKAKLSASEGSTDAAAVGAGAGAGVALLLFIVIVVAVIFWRRRRSSTKLEKHDSGSIHVSPVDKQTDPDLVYSNIDNTRTETDGPGAIGVSNLLYANVRMSDVSKEEETNTTVEIARPVSEDYLKEEEIIDGVLPEELETDAEVDNTYYNVAGKRVAVANLPEYIRNKSLGDIYADFQRIPKGLLKDYKEAKKAKNVHKNKYRFIYPYDESRVILHVGGSDYINASYIQGYRNKKEYIASSGPFKKSYDTTPDFWRMIWQEKCKNIVMLTNPEENGETKCIKYWPELNGSNNFGKIQVTTLTEDRYSDFTIRIFTLTKGGESFNVRHLHFTAWPDKGVPHDVTSMIEFRQKVWSLHKDKNCPLLVHCSAGIGRTGTFIALDMLTYEGEDRGSVDIFDCVAALRSQRCNMVQTMEQYDYLHHAVLHSLTFDCRSIAGDMFLQNYNKLIERNGGERIIDIQFQHLQLTTEEITDEDKADVHRNQALPNKNRDGADIPVDEYRVRLRENRKPGAVDYINAVWINGFRTRHKFIVAQTPLQSTVVDFLTLVLQEKCSCIVMMEEADISNKSVGVYWPADNQSTKHGVFKISCKDSTSTQNYSKKTLSITCHGSKGEDSHEVHLFIFTKWSKGNIVPKSSDSVLQLMKAVDTVNRSKDKESTILVHCMTGSERSCVYCAISILIEKMEIEHEVSVVNTLRQIKARRRSAFSSLDQYKFCHQAVISYLQSFETYSNFGLRDSEASSV